MNKKMTKKDLKFAIAAAQIIVYSSITLAVFIFAEIIAYKFIWN